MSGRTSLLYLSLCQSLPLLLVVGGSGSPRRPIAGLCGAGGALVQRQGPNQLAKDSVL